MSGKSKEEVAFELVSKLKGVGVWGENNMQQILDMYAECLEATSGLRPAHGRQPAALQLIEASSAPEKAPAAIAPRQAPAQPSQVRQQQQRVQQAYQQQTR